jgi:hypothetical protein
MSRLSPNEVNIVLASKAANLLLGITDTNVMSVSRPATRSEEMIPDPLLYGGVYPAAMVLESWAYSGLVNATIKSTEWSNYTFFNSLIGQALETAKYKAEQLSAELTIGAYGLANTVPGNFSQTLAQTITPNYPSERADASSKEAARGQMFNFYFRSLKPSIYKQDKDNQDKDNQLNPILGPRGIMRLQPIITSLTESYNPNWEKQPILGSVQQIHRYVRTDRSISLGFTMFADSYQQLQFNIWRLNWLADHCYGRLMNFDDFRQDNQNQNTDSSKFVQNIEYKEFPFIKVTIGTVFVELPCYIDSMNITYAMDAPWEIGDQLENRASKWNSLQFPFKIDVSVTLNVLYDTIDPTNKNYYRQYLETDASNYIKWTSDAGNTNPDDDIKYFDIFGDTVRSIIPGAN